MIKIATFYLLYFLPSFACGQISLFNINEAKKHLVSSGIYSIELDSSGNVDYVKPFVNYQIDNSKTQVSNDNRQVSPLYAALGCYKHAINLLEDPDRASRTDQTFRNYIQENINHISIDLNPVTFICNKAASAPITMINEAHDFPYHRAFVMSLLPELRKKGYKYLAMETLNNSSYFTNSKHLNSLSQRTGYYTNEPIMGELVRYALELGYSLIPYEFVPSSFSPINVEDTVQFKQRVHERDSIQALNIIDAVKKCSDGKILVVAGYDHILESVERTDYFNPFYPMALYFKEMSKIDPLTINQVPFSSINPGTKTGDVYRVVIEKKKSGTPICIRPDDTAVVGHGVQRDLSDIYILLPETAYKNDRPTWLDLNGLRKCYQYSLPASIMKKVVLIQAYYLDEVNSETDINIKVPADQLMLLNTDKINFYLRPEHDYLVVCRDVNNKIIYRKSLTCKY